MCDFINLEDDILVLIVHGGADNAREVDKRQVWHIGSWERERRGGREK